MEIKKEWLEKEITNMAQQMEATKAQVSAMSGALEAFKHIIARLDAPEEAPKEEEANGTN